MAERAGDWPGAAACCEGPRPRATFADLPLHHQDQIVRFAFLAAASIAYGITLGVLMRPIASRSLLTGAALPHGAHPRSALLEARAALSVGTVSPPRASAHTASPRTHVALIDEQAAVKASNGPAAAAPRQERRGNIVSRFFRGMWRSVQAPLKAEYM